VTPSPKNDPLELNASPWIRKQVDTYLLFGSSQMFFWTLVAIYLVLLSCVELLAFKKNNPDLGISADLLVPRYFQWVGNGLKGGSSS
jgi:hypothetical protein